MKKRIDIQHVLLFHNNIYIRKNIKKEKLLETIHKLFLGKVICVIFYSLHLHHHRAIKIMKL